MENGEYFKIENEYQLRAAYNDFKFRYSLDYELKDFKKGNYRCVVKEDGFCFLQELEYVKNDIEIPNPYANIGYDFQFVESMPKQTMRVRFIDDYVHKDEYNKLKDKYERLKDKCGQTYSIGQRFLDNFLQQEFLLCRSDENNVGLVNIKNGNRYENFIEVNDCLEITLEEAEKIGINEMKLINKL